MRARMKSEKCKRPQFFFADGRADHRAGHGTADGQAKCKRSNLLQCRKLLQCSNATAAMQVQQFSAMQQCICNNATAAMQVQQFLRCSNAGAAMQAQQQMPHRSIRAGGSPMEKLTPPMEKFRPHRWKRSDLTDGKVQPPPMEKFTPPMEKFTAALRLP